MPFLTGLPIAKALGVAALVVMLTLTVLWKAADRRADKWERQARKLSAIVDRISSERNEQKVRTERIIVEVEKGRKGAETIAKQIEAAPLPGLCKTPDAVMGADL